MPHTKNDRIVLGNRKHRAPQQKMGIMPTELFHMHSIPTVNMNDFGAGGESRARFIEALGIAAHEVGFVAVEHHGIEDGVIEHLRHLARQVFALPDNIKRAHEHPETGRQIGYACVGSETAAGACVPDKKEFWHIRPEGQPLQNVFPTQVPEFGHACLNLITRLDKVAYPLLEGLRAYMDIMFPQVLTFADFAELTKNGDSVLRVLHYPSDPSTAPGIRAEAHTDINWITLLLQADKPGLQVQTRNSTEWIDVTNPPDSIIMNIGDMLECATCGYYRSTRHRVVDPAAPDGGRIAIPYFIHPRLGSVLLTSDTFLRHRLTEIGLYK